MNDAEIEPGTLFHSAYDGNIWFCIGYGFWLLCATMEMITYDGGGATHSLDLSEGTIVFPNGTTREINRHNRQ